MSTAPKGAGIEVEARRVDAEVEIAVIDDGPGIPSEQLEHIFERFTRGDAGLTQRVGGTGLGLAISKSLVELHGGTIGVESSPGAGADLPLPPAGRAGARPGRRRLGGGLRWRGCWSPTTRRRSCC